MTQRTLSFPLRAVLRLHVADVPDLALRNLIDDYVALIGADRLHTVRGTFGGLDAYLLHLGATVGETVLLERTPR